MRTHLTILCLLWTVPANAVDTLRVAPQPHPFSESRLWTEFDLPGAVRNIFEDREGNAWFATDVGAVHYDGRHFRTYTTEDGLGTDDVRAITQTSDGALWFGTSGGGITRLLADGVRTYTVEDGLAGDAVNFGGLALSEDGGLWAGFSGTGGLSCFDGRAWAVVETPLDSVSVKSLIETDDGSVWIATYGQGLLRLRGGEWTVFGPEQGLPGLRFNEIIQTSDGSVWATSFDETAIARYKDDEWTVYGPANGLTNEKHLSIWETSDGHIWSANTVGDIVTFSDKGWHGVDSVRKPSSITGVLARPGRSGSVWLFAFKRPLAYRIRAREQFHTRFDVDRPLRGGVSHTRRLHVVRGR